MIPWNPQLAEMAIAQGGGMHYGGISPHAPIAPVGAPPRPDPAVLRQMAQAHGTTPIGDSHMDAERDAYGDEDLYGQPESPRIDPEEREEDEAKERARQANPQLAAFLMSALPQAGASIGRLIDSDRRGKTEIAPADDAVLSFLRRKG